MKKTVLISTAIAATCACAIAAYFVFKPSETDKLFEQCEEKVLARLVSPKTAVFGEYSHTPRHIKTYEHSDSKFDIEGFNFAIDSQNTFGAMIRSDWYCQIYYKEDEISLIEIERLKE